MRRALIAAAGLALASAVAATAEVSTCLDSTWTSFADTLGAEEAPVCYKAFVPGQDGAEALPFSLARAFCTTLGREATPRLASRLLTMSDKSKTSAGTSLLAAALSGCSPHQQVAGYCPVFWVGAVRAVKNINPKAATFTWIDKTSDDNLLMYSKGECTDPNQFVCGPWGYWDNPTDNSNGWVPDYGNTGVDGNTADEITFPNGCVHDTTGSTLKRCSSLAAGAEFFGLIDRPTSTTLGYICIHDKDTDGDGKPDYKDFCPNSPFMPASGSSNYLTCVGNPANPKCTDRAGCNKLEMDVDADLVCTSPSPVVALPGIFRPINARCANTAGVDSVDVCPLVNNKGQSTAACPAGAPVGCHVSCAFGCESTGLKIALDSIKACTNPVDAVTSIPDLTQRCKAGYTPITKGGKYTKGCVAVV